MNGAYFLNSGVLYDVAQQAYERTLSADTERAGNQRDALVAVIFSAATLEALVMDLTLKIQISSRLAGHTNRTRAFGPKRPPTPDELSLLNQFLGGGS